ncbi:unnamed protein product [Closterium sp. NIES-54]
MFPVSPQSSQSRRRRWWRMQTALFEAAASPPPLPLPPTQHTVPQPSLCHTPHYAAPRCQPITAQEMAQDADSEDEWDEAAASYADRKLLGEFEDVLGEEKGIMHRWMAFVRRHRVIADRHVPWTCEAFAITHKDFLSSSPCTRINSLTACTADTFLLALPPSSPPPPSPLPPSPLPPSPLPASLPFLPLSPPHFHKGASCSF